MTLNELITGCKKNNRIAQSELFRQYKDTLFLTSLKYCRNEVEAEDNLHDAFMAIFEGIDNYKNKGSFEGWMRRIVIHKAIAKYKQNKLIATEINDDLLKEDTYVSEETHFDLDQILESIQSLPDQYRLVFNMYQMDGYSHKEIALHLGISESTSKSNYHRAKALLRKMLTQKKTTTINTTSHEH